MGKAGLILGFVFLCLGAAIPQYTHASVSMKCEVIYDGLESRGASGRTQSFIEEIPLSKAEVGSGENYIFDHVRTLSEVGRGDLLLWTEGNYFRNVLRPADTYLMLTHFLCLKDPSSGEIRCLDNTSTTTLPVHKFSDASSTIYRGKNILMHKAFLSTVASEKGRDFLMKYRMEKGHKYQKDLVYPRDLAKLTALYDPSVSLKCAVQDDEYGIEDAFSK